MKQPFIRRGFLRPRIAARTASSKSSLSGNNCDNLSSVSSDSLFSWFHSLCGEQHFNLTAWYSSFSRPSPLKGDPCKAEAAKSMKNQGRHQRAYFVQPDRLLCSSSSQTQDP
uniref:Uncharacterized protein n=1 Tax=Salix viminalis TaxID=40686 RepID=A0A6N2N3T8_SALVM